jgi:hypothetical protein
VKFFHDFFRWVNPISIQNCILIFLYIFLNCFNILILKINFKNKNYYFNIFLKNITLKNNHYHVTEHLESHLWASELNIAGITFVNWCMIYLFKGAIFFNYYYLLMAERLKKQKKQPQLFLLDLFTIIKIVSFFSLISTYQYSIFFHAWISYMNTGNLWLCKRRKAISRWLEQKKMADWTRSVWKCGY